MKLAHADFKDAACSPCWVGCCGSGWGIVCAKGYSHRRRPNDSKQSVLGCTWSRRSCWARRLCPYLPRSPPFSSATATRSSSCDSNGYLAGSGKIRYLTLFCSRWERPLGRPHRHWNDPFTTSKRRFGIEAETVSPCCYNFDLHSLFIMFMAVEKSDYCTKAMIGSYDCFKCLPAFYHLEMQ